MKVSQGWETTLSFSCSSSSTRVYCQHSSKEHKKKSDRDMDYEIEKGVDVYKNLTDLKWAGKNWLEWKPMPRPNTIGSFIGGWRLASNDISLWFLVRTSEYSCNFILKLACIAGLAWYASQPQLTIMWPWRHGAIWWCHTPDTFCTSMYQQQHLFGRLVLWRR